VRRRCKFKNKERQSHSDAPHNSQVRRHQKSQKKERNFGSDAPYKILLKMEAEPPDLRYQAEPGNE